MTFLPGKWGLLCVPETSTQQASHPMEQERGLANWGPGMAFLGAAVKKLVEGLQKGAGATQRGRGPWEKRAVTHWSMLLNIHSPFFLKLEGRQRAQPQGYLSRLPAAREKWAWDPVLVNDELVGNAKLPKRLFKKWTDLAGTCLCPSSQPPFMPGTRTQCQ